VRRSSAHGECRAESKEGVDSKIIFGRFVVQPFSFYNMLINGDEGLHMHLSARLALCKSEMCTTESDVRMLCDFIMVLLQKKEYSAEELRETMLAELAGFLHAETESFVSQFFSDLDSKPWEQTYEPQGKAPVESVGNEYEPHCASHSLYVSDAAGKPGQLTLTDYREELDLPPLGHICVYRCPDCGITFETWWDCGMHVKDTHARATKARYCRVYVSHRHCISDAAGEPGPLTLTDNRKELDLPPLGLKYRCPDCGITFEAWGDCKAHCKNNGHGKRAGRKCYAGLQQRCMQALQNASSAPSASGKKKKSMEGQLLWKQRAAAAVAPTTTFEEPFLICPCSSPCLPGACPIRDSGKRQKLLPTHVRVLAICIHV